MNRATVVRVSSVIDVVPFGCRDGVALSRMSVLAGTTCAGSTFRCTLMNVKTSAIASRDCESRIRIVMG